VSELSQATLELIRPPTLVDSTAEAIRVAIFSGQIGPGQRLVEAEIARKLKISRGPVREALALLAKDGIVVNVPRRGKFVQGFTPELIDELYSLRRLLEPYAVSRVIASLDAAITSQLEGAVQAIADAVASEDPQLVAQRDIAFHDLVYDLAGHDLLKRAWLENIAGKLQILLHVTTQTLGALRDAEQQHRQLVDSIISQDEARARARFEGHIDEAWERAHRGLWGPEHQLETNPSAE
jgi:DNA-binding GntR family transcriptional regulator